MRDCIVCHDPSEIFCDECQNELCQSCWNMLCRRRAMMDNMLNCPRRFRMHQEKHGKHL